mgnify:CR=1 FL=1
MGKLQIQSDIHEGVGQGCAVGAAPSPAPNAVTINECVNVRCIACERSLLAVGGKDSQCAPHGAACGMGGLLRLAANAKSCGAGAAPNAAGQEDQTSSGRSDLSAGKAPAPAAPRLGRGNPGALRAGDRRALGLGPARRKDK